SPSGRSCSPASPCACIAGIPVGCKAGRSPVGHAGSVTVTWSDEVDDVLRGDITAALAYVTPAGGAGVTAVGPCGLGGRARGEGGRGGSGARAGGRGGFTPCLGSGKSLERIVRYPRVALPSPSRQHGFSSRPPYVLAQGDASADLTPSEARLDEFAPQAEHYL